MPRNAFAIQIYMKKKFGIPGVRCRCIVVFCSSNTISLTVIILFYSTNHSGAPAKFTLYNRTAINKFTKDVHSNIQLFQYWTVFFILQKMMRLLFPTTRNLSLSINYQLYISVDLPFSLWYTHKNLTCHHFRIRKYKLLTHKPILLSHFDLQFL